MRPIALAAICGVIVIALHLINHIPASAIHLLIAGGLLLLFFLGGLLFILLLIAILSPTNGAGAHQEQPPIINQTFVSQITLLFNGPGQTHVLPNSDRPAAQPKTLLPDRGRPNPDW